MQFEKIKRFVLRYFTIHFQFRLSSSLFCMYRTFSCITVWSTIFLFIQNNLIMTNNHPVFKTELQWANRSDKSHIHSLLALKLAYPSFYTNNLWEICWKWKPVFVLNIVLLGNQPEYKFCLSFISYNQRINYGFLIFSSILGRLFWYRWGASRR